MLCISFSDIHFLHTISDHPVRAERCDETNREVANVRQSSVKTVLSKDTKNSSRTFKDNSWLFIISYLYYNISIFLIRFKKTY